MVFTMLKKWWLRKPTSRFLVGPSRGEVRLARVTVIPWPWFTTEIHNQPWGYSTMSQNQFWCLISWLVPLANQKTTFIVLANRLVPIIRWSRLPNPVGGFIGRLTNIFHRGKRKGNGHIVHKPPGAYSNIRERERVRFFIVQPPTRNVHLITFRGRCYPRLEWKEWSWATT